MSENVETIETTVGELIVAISDAALESQSSEKEVPGYVAAVLVELFGADKDTIPITI